MIDPDFTRGYWVASDGDTYTAPIAADGLLLVDERRPTEHSPAGLIDPDPSDPVVESSPGGTDPIVVVPELSGAVWLTEGSPNHPSLAAVDETGRVVWEEAGEPVERYFESDDEIAAMRRAHSVAINYQHQKEGNQS